MNKKRWLLTILCLFLTFCLCAVASADETEGKWSYTVKDGSATITAFSGTPQEFIVPQTLGGYPVTRLGAYSALLNDATISFSVPEWITTIGDKAFKNVTFTNAVTFPASLTRMDHGFEDCTFEQDVVVKMGSVANSPFRRCVFNGNLTLSDSVNSVGYGCFMGSTFTKDLVLPDSLTDLGLSAFNSCTFNGSLTLPCIENWYSGGQIGLANLRTIIFKDARAFSVDTLFNGEPVSPLAGCYTVTQIVLPDDLTSVSADNHLLDPFSKDRVKMVCTPGSNAEAWALANGYTVTSEISESEPTIYSDSGFTYILDNNGNAVVTGYSGIETALVIPDTLGGASVTEIDYAAFKSRTDLTSLVLPSGLKVIGNNAFEYCTGLSGSLVIPDRVVTIGDYAFRGCQSLSGNLSIPDSVVTVGSHAFATTRFKGTLILGSSLTTIGDGAFSYNPEGGPGGSIQNSFKGPLVIPENVKTIGEGSFAGCGFDSVIIEAKITAIPEQAFCDCYSVKEWILPESLLSIGPWAFADCKFPQGMYLPSTLKSIDTSSEESTFLGSSGKFILADTMTLDVTTLPSGFSLSARAGTDTASKLLSSGISFTDTITGLTVTQDGDFQLGTAEDGTVTLLAYTGSSSQVTIPNSVTVIGPEAFAGNTSISELHLNNTVAIGNGAFKKCRSLNWIQLSSSLSSVAVDAFDGCQISVVDLPQTLGMSAADLPFPGNTSYTTDYVPTTPVNEALAAGYEVRDLNDSLVTKDGDFYIGLNGGGGNTFLLAYDGTETEIVVADEVTIIDLNGMLTANNTVNTITLPSSLRSIKAGSLSKLAALTDIYLPDTIAISDANISTSFPQGYTYHAKAGSETAIKLLSAGIIFLDTETGRTIKPDSPASDFEYTVDTTYNEVNITGYIGTDSIVVIPATIEGAPVKAIRSRAFEDNTTITEVSVPDGVDTIYSYAFYNCSNLASVFLPAELYSIDKYAFAGTALRSIVIPEITTLHDGVFSGCTSLTEITLPSSLQSIGDTARDTFNGCTALTDVILPDTMGIRISALPFASTVTYHASSGSSTADQLHALKKVFIDRATGELHTDAILPAVAPTCTEAGLTEGTQCTVCGYVTTAQQAVPALEHDWHDATYTWAEDNSTVTATRICKHDETHIETETATVTTTVTKPATCEEAGETTYTAAFTNEAFATQTKTLADIPAIGHNWNEPAYAWADDNSTVTATRVCKHDGNHVETETATVTSTVTKAATCEEAGETTYSASFTNEAFATQSKTLADIPAIGHDWDEPAYSWADDNSTVTSTRICKHDETHIETETAAVTAEITKAATCEESGETTYSTAFTNAAFAPQSKTLADIPAIGHDWNEPAYAWADDSSTVIATRVCNHDGNHVETETAKATSAITKAATCEEAGETTYSAIFTNAAFVLQSKTLADIPAIGHDWDEPAYTWADDNTTVTATRICKHDGNHVETETVTVTAEITKPAACEEVGETTYSAVFTNAAFTPQSKTLADIPAIGHDWDEPAYSWADDNSTVTATRICKHDETHIETETAAVTAEITKAATCEESGETTYSAAFTNAAFAPQSKTLVDIPAIGHDWSEPSYVWADDNSTVTATRICKHDETHIETETATVTSTVTKAATCEEAGETTYSASFTNEAFATQSKTLADIPAIGHDWDEPAYSWADDNSTVTSTRICKHDETHIETETAAVTAEVTKSATCEEAGETTYSAAFTNAAFEAQSKVLSDIPATGHTPVFTPGMLPTANASGYTAGSTCSVCGKILADHMPVESVQTLALPTALKTINAKAFEKTAADYVLIPVGTITIGSRAFADAPNLRFITVPDSVTDIAPDAFEGCSLVTFFCSDTSAAAEYAEEHGFAHTAP